MAKITIDENICKGCEMCINTCPSHILKLSSSHINKKGYYVAEVIEPEQCTGCTSCAIVCPDVAITVER